MVNVTSLESILQSLKRHNEVLDATLVSRSGMHVAGQVPKGAHLETFVAMSAILLGAAETATTELQDKLENVVVELNGSKLVISSTGTKALLVLRVKPKIDYKKLMHEVHATVKEIENFL